MEHTRRDRFLPSLLTLTIIGVDQLTKAWVVATIPQGTVHVSFFSDFLWICHVRNLAIGFSIGAELPDPLKSIFFIFIPLVLLVLLIIYMIRSHDISLFQRWMVAGIIGGGLGNIIDRIFRPAGVVDFVSVRVYGLFGFDRWPTFNVADASIVVTGILLMINILFFQKKTQVTDEEKEIPNE